MSTEKNKEALQAMRAKYKETFGEEPAANLGLPQLTKKIKEYEAGATEKTETTAPATPVSDAVTDPAPVAPEPAAVESAEVTAAADPAPETTAPVVEVQAAATEVAAPAVNDPEEKAPVSRKNQKPITAADMKVEKVLITNGKVTKPYTKFAWDNFLSKAPGKWRLVANTPPEVLSLTGGSENE